MYYYLPRGVRCARGTVRHVVAWAFWIKWSFFQVWPLLLCDYLFGPKGQAHAGGLLRQLGPLLCSLALSTVVLLCRARAECLGQSTTRCLLNRLDLCSDHHRLLECTLWTSTQTLTSTYAQSGATASIYQQCQSLICWHAPAHNGNSDARRLSTPTWTNHQGRLRIQYRKP